MADAVTSQTLQDGDKSVVMKFTNISDGSGEAAVKKVDVSALQSPSQAQMLHVLGCRSSRFTMNSTA